MFDNLLTKCSLIMVFIVFLIVILYKAKSINETFQNNTDEEEDSYDSTLNLSEESSTNSESNNENLDEDIRNYLNNLYSNTEEEATPEEESFARRIYTSTEEENTLQPVDIDSHQEGLHDELTDEERWLLSDEGQVWLSTLEGLNWLVNTEEGQDFWRLVCKLNEIPPVFCDFFANIRELSLDCQNRHPQDPDECFSKALSGDICKRMDSYCDSYYKENNIDINSSSYTIDENSPNTEKYCGVTGFLCAWQKFKNSQSKDVKVSDNRDVYKNNLKVIKSFVSSAADKVKPPEQDNSHWPAGGFQTSNKKDSSLMTKCLGDDILRQREYIISRPVPVNKDGSCNYHDGQYHLSSNDKLCRSCAPGEMINYDVNNLPKGGAECQPCENNTISSKRNSKKCVECPPGTKPNKSRTECITCEGSDCQTHMTEGNYVTLNKYRENKKNLEKTISNLSERHNSDVDKLQSVIAKISNTL